MIMMLLTLVKRGNALDVFLKPFPGLADRQIPKLKTKHQRKVGEVKQVLAEDLETVFYTLAGNVKQTLAEDLNT